MNKAVLKNGKRFKTWTFDVSRDLPQETDKVFDYNLNITVTISQPMNYTEDFYTWLIKHSSCITAIKFSEYLDLPEKVIDSLSQLKQVRKLDLYLDYNNMYEVKTLLISLGPQLEILTVKAENEGIVILNETDLTNLNLASLKHLKLDQCDREMISSILKIVPANIQSLELIGRDVEIPSGMKQLTNLKCLRIENHHYNKPKLPAMLLCKSLTRLDLYRVDLEDLELVDTDLPSLEILKLRYCKIKMGLLKNLLKKSSLSLHKLTLDDIIDNEDLDCSLPVLTTLELNNMRNITWLSQLISACSRSLTTLKLYRIDSCSLYELSCDLPVLTTLELKIMRNINGLSQLISACSTSLTTLKLHSLFGCSLDELISDLPALKVMSFKYCDLDINNFLRKCSSSLQILYLNKVSVKFEVNVPNLKEFHIMCCTVNGFTNLVSPEGSSLEIIGLYDVRGSIWDDIERCRFSNVKVVYMKYKDRGKIEKLKTSIITPHVQVITDEKKWRQHLKDRMLY